MFFHHVWIHKSNAWWGLGSSMQKASLIQHPHHLCKQASCTQSNSAMANKSQSVWHATLAKDEVYSNLLCWQHVSCMHVSLRACFTACVFHCERVSLCLWAYTDVRVDIICLRWCSHTHHASCFWCIAVFCIYSYTICITHNRYV